MYIFSERIYEWKTFGRVFLLFSSAVQNRLTPLSLPSTTIKQPIESRWVKRERATQIMILKNVVMRAYYSFITTFYDENAAALHTHCYLSMSPLIADSFIAPQRRIVKIEGERTTATLVFLLTCSRSGNARKKIWMNFNATESAPHLISVLFVCHSFPFLFLVNNTFKWCHSIRINRVHSFSEASRDIARDGAHKITSSEKRR